MERALDARAAAARRANPSPRLQALLSAFDGAGPPPAAGEGGTPPPPPQQQEGVAGAMPGTAGLTQAEHRARERAAVVATWQVPAVPLFFAAPRGQAKAVAALLAARLTLAKLHDARGLVAVGPRR